MLRQRRTTARILATWGAGLMLLLQVVGLQQLCACGGCAVSRALGIHNDEHFAGDGHPCCAEMDEASAGPGWHAADDPCGCEDAHIRHAPDAALRPLPALPDGPPVLAVVNMSAIAPDALADANLSVRTHLSRGPPDMAAGPPLYLRQLVLRI